MAPQAITVSAAQYLAPGSFEYNSMVGQPPPCIVGKVAALTRHNPVTMERRRGSGGASLQRVTLLRAGVSGMCHAWSAFILGAGHSHRAPTGASAVAIHLARLEQAAERFEKYAEKMQHADTAE